MIQSEMHKIAYRGWKFNPVNMWDCVVCSEINEITDNQPHYRNLLLAMVRFCLVVFFFFFFYWQLNDLSLDRTPETVAGISRISLIWHTVCWPELKTLWVWVVGLGTWKPFFTSLSPKTGLLAVSWQGLILYLFTTPSYFRRKG